MRENYLKQIADLDADLDALAGELSRYSPEKLNQKPAPDKWSALQVAHHLILAEEQSIQYLSKKMSFKPRVKKSGLLTRLRVGLLRIYLNTPLRFKAPNIVGDEVLPETSDLATTLEQWRAVRARLKEVISTMPEEYLQTEIYRHPLAGRMDPGGMLVFFQEHFDRHRQQILRTLAG